MNNKHDEITCFAKNCIHHKGETTCSAAGIEVGNSSACRCGETQCSTFKLNDNAIGKSCGCAD